MAPAMDADGVERARASLERIEHIVVLMLENRSFDHKFGYLSFPEHALPDHGELPVKVNGIDLADPRFTIHHGGRPYAPQPLDEDAFLKRELDPPHDADSVRTQLGGGAMNGFVDSFAHALERRGADGAGDPEVLGNVMGYLVPERIPVSDHVARNFCLCDNWFCSVPGPTLPNRFFSVAGTTNGVLDNFELVVGQFGKFESLFRHLGKDAWRWYSSDPGILRAVDGAFMFDDAADDHFAYFDELTEKQPRSFLRDVLGDSLNEPDLPAVSWIDPNFAMSKMVPAALAHLLKDGPLSNDDHPPSPSQLGQKLVHKVYRALGESKYWDSTLLVVTYDEHGGFFDHVAPPPGHGPRVPVLLVSPHVKRGVSSVGFDHASVIKTILLRFGREGSWNEMGERVRDAQDLSVVLRDMDDASTAPFVPVANPGSAALGTRDLIPTFLPHGGSTLNHTIGFDDEKLTDLQRDIIRGIAVPLRTGVLFLARTTRSKWLRKLLPLFKVFKKPKSRRLEPRRP
jgi:phospholipase C